MRPHIRTARRDDAGEIVRLAQLFSQERGIGPSKLRADDLLRHGFGDGAVFSLQVAERTARLVGYALYYPGFDSVAGARGFYLADLFVELRERQQGTGQRLLAAVAADVVARDGAWLIWNAIADDDAVRRFYGRLGAREHALVTYSLELDQLRQLARGSGRRPWHLALRR